MVAIALCCVALVVMLKFQGLLLAVIVLAAVYFMTRNRPDQREVLDLRSSIQLSAEDIEDVLSQYHDFLHSVDSDAIADRTLLRPALADADCEDEAIQRFFFLQGTSERFLRRVRHRLTKELSVGQLEKLLSVTDRRAMELQEAWTQARRRARQLAR